MIHLLLQEMHWIIFFFFTKTRIIEVRNLTGHQEETLALITFVEIINCNAFLQNVSLNLFRIIS